ncbi:MAG: hypothetical protein QN168_03550 [Armatimonadota bacterium]|nr:hypothetical protein [Armatimonadota bacterium]
MASDYLAEARQNRALLTRIAQALQRLAPDQPPLTERVTEVQETVHGKLTALRTALTALDALKSRDRTGANPTLADQYNVHYETIEAVATYCAVELTPALERLRRDFDGRPEAEALDRILQDVQAARAADVHSESRREERDAPDAAWAPRAQTGREAVEAELEEPAVVAVSPLLLGQLQAHQERLGDYIQGYISCQALSARCDEARTAFEEARARGLRPTDWERVRRFVNEMRGMVTGLGPAFKGDEDDFREPVGSLDSAVRDARSVVRAAMSGPPKGAPDEMAEALARHLADIRNALDEIGTLCPPKADKTLGELRDVINQIFGQIEKARHARQRFTERAGDVPAKIWPQVSARTERTAGKGA